MTAITAAATAAPSATKPAAAAGPSAAKPAARKGGRLIKILFALIVIAGGAGAAWYFLLHKPGPAAAEHAPKADPIYVSLEPAFVVNLEDDDSMRFMQVDVQVVVTDAKLGELIKLHMPMIRNRLLLLFSGQHYQELNSRPAKEQLQQAALEEVRKLIKEQTGKDGVEALYFTSLVMQ
jgi:flagellar FliL protein